MLRRFGDGWTFVPTVPGLGCFFGGAAGGGSLGAGGGGYRHVPVMVREVLEYLEPREGKTIVDATLGGAGHAAAILDEGARLIGLDRDPEALAHAEALLAPHGEAFVSRRANFSDLAEVAWELAPEGVEGVLMDLGVSSHQLDSPGRGFSLRCGGPLDMRMDPDEELTAEVIVNEWEEGELERVIREFGEERRSKAIARAIVRRRAGKPFRETLDLAACVAAVVGGGGRHHPATRVFQALRIAVNLELEALERALAAAPVVLKPGGRLVVITFHSLEDRIVKQFLRRRSAAELDRPEWPGPRPNPERTLRVLTRRPVVAGAGEVGRNPRARSAKLRAAEKLEGGAGR